jgi:hypothetical protein
MSNVEGNTKYKYKYKQGTRNKKQGTRNRNVELRGTENYKLKTVNLKEPWLSEKTRHVI